MFFLFFFVPVIDGTLSLCLCHYLLLLFYCLVWGYYSDCAVVHFSGVSGYIIYYAPQQCLKSSKTIKSVIFTCFLFFQVMNSVSCGKLHNVEFVTTFIFFCFTKPRSGKRTTFLQGPGKVVMVAICM